MRDASSDSTPSTHSCPACWLWGYGSRGCSEAGIRLPGQCLAATLGRLDKAPRPPGPPLATGLGSPVASSASRLVLSRTGLDDEEFQWRSRDSSDHEHAPASDTRFGLIDINQGCGQAFRIHQPRIDAWST